jgi:predicted phosphodiesterase
LKIAVLSDIHSAAEQFRDALDAARNEGFDRLVILGDLFTYGPDPVRCLEIAEEAAARDGAVLITGNHDVLYMEGGEAGGYRAALPEWIAESIEWTSAQLDDRRRVSALPWQDEWTDDGVLFSHANPFGGRDWTYLRDADSVAQASDALRKRGFNWGIFGHVHRFRLYPNENGGGVATVGSLGQPRDRAEPFSQWAMVTTGPQVSIDPRPLERGWSSTIESICSSSMTEATKERLCQFYR